MSDRRATRVLPDVWFHRWGTPVAEDTRELSGVFVDDRIVENFLAASP